jgi:hypothetical protein
MSSDVDKVIETHTSAHIRTRDLGQALDMLEGLQRIMTSFAAEQRGRHAADPLLVALRGIHGHGYNWESLRYQDGVGEGWLYIAASIEQLRTRLHVNLDHDLDRVTGSDLCRGQRKVREIDAEIVGQRERE